MCGASYAAYTVQQTRGALPGVSQHQSYKYTAFKWQASKNFSHCTTMTFRGWGLRQLHQTWSLWQGRLHARAAKGTSRCDTNQVKIVCPVIRNAWPASDVEQASDWTKCTVTLYD